MNEMHFRPRRIVSIIVLGLVSSAMGCSDAAEAEPKDEPTRTPIEPPALDPKEPVADTRGDAAPPQSDAGSLEKATVEIAQTGTIELLPEILLAYFRHDDTVVRTADEPSCVLFVRSIDKPFSNGGALKVDGDWFGQTGSVGSVQTFIADEAQRNAYEYFLDPGQAFFPQDAPSRIRIEKVAAAAFPAIGVTSLRTPTATPLEVSQPAAPADGTLALRAETGLTINWTPPSTAGDPEGLPEGRVVVALKGLASATREADLRCGFRPATGSARIPASLFGEIRERLGAARGAAVTGGRLSIGFGDQRELRSPGATYVVQVTRPEATTFVDADVTLAE